jgi:hypothetical protein
LLDKMHLPVLWKIQTISLSGRFYRVKANQRRPPRSSRETCLPMNCQQKNRYTTTRR